MSMALLYCLVVVEDGMGEKQEDERRAWFKVEVDVDAEVDVWPKWAR